MTEHDPSRVSDETQQDATAHQSQWEQEPTAPQGGWQTDAPQQQWQGAPPQQGWGQSAPAQGWGQQGYEQSGPIPQQGWQPQGPMGGYEASGPIPQQGPVGQEYTGVVPGMSGLNRPMAPRPPKEPSVLGKVFTDLGFSEVLTPRIARIVYLVVIAAAALWWLEGVIRAFATMDYTGALNAVLVLLVGWLPMLALVLLTRVGLEFFVHSAQSRQDAVAEREAAPVQDDDVETP